MPKTLDGQRLLVPPDAKCESCSQPAGGRLVFKEGKYQCPKCVGLTLAVDLAGSGVIATDPAIVCWLPDGVDRRCPAKPARTTLVNWNACLTQLCAYPERWGRGEDLTAEHERRVVKDRLRGMPEDQMDAEKVEAIRGWRSPTREGMCEPRWGEWCEFVVDVEGKPLRVLSLGPCSASDGNQLSLQHPDISDTGWLTVWAVRGDAPREGESLPDYARRVATREVEARRKKQRRGGRKQAPRSAREERI